jgi:hypothetical protein
MSSSPRDGGLWTDARPSMDAHQVTETRIIPPWARERGLTRCFVYNGPSMTPTFQPGHLLYVRPARADIAVGDVVVFSDPVGDGYVVHRVISASGVGWVARGDNNARADPFPVDRCQIIGRVEMAEVRGRIQPVRGGSQGLWSARIRWRAHRMGRWLRRPVVPLYRALRDSTILHRTLGRWLSPHLRVVRVETPTGPLFKTTYKGRIVARWWPQLDRYECRKPFDLVIPRPDGA